MCSSKGEDKTHSFPKPPHSWSKSPKLSWADWTVASAGDTHHASEVPNLELLAVQPKHPDAPLSDAGCHWQGFPGMGALGEQKAFQFLRSLLHPELFWTCSLRSSGAFQNQSILPSLPKPPPLKPLTTFPWAVVTQLPSWNCVGEQLRSLLSAENPTPSLLSYLHPLVLNKSLLN